MNLAAISSELKFITPHLILAATACLALIMDCFISRKKESIGLISIIGVIIAGVSIIWLWNVKISAFNKMIVVDNLSLIFNFIFLISAVLIFLISREYNNKVEIDRGEYYPLILFACLGMMIMASGIDLIVIFIGIEIMSLSLYILAGFRKGFIRSQESALKYFLLGAFASAFLLYGIALMYAASGSTNLIKIMELMKTGGAYKSVLFLGGTGLLIVGLGFKIAAVPFHMWAPDVYEGAPTPVVGFMSVAVKAAAFIVILRIFLEAFRGFSQEWMMVFYLLSIMTMTAGNIIALKQSNIKRMLAYSGIAHAGYILIGIIIGTEYGAVAVTFYLLAYLFTNIGAFGIVSVFENKDGDFLDIKDYAGLSRKHPVFSLVFTFFLLSLIGIPPAGGFVAKLYLFSAAIKEGYIILAVVGVLNSVISCFYYLRIVMLMYMKESMRETTPSKLTFSSSFALFICFFMLLILGIYPAPLFSLLSSIMVK